MILGKVLKMRLNGNSHNLPGMVRKIRVNREKLGHAEKNHEHLFSTGSTVSVFDGGGG
jgi:hypothetical protein